MLKEIDSYDAKTNKVKLDADLITSPNAPQSSTDKISAVNEHIVTDEILDELKSIGRN
jgi:hypothetical protein